VIERILMHLGLQARAPPSGACPWPGAASGLTLPSRDRSGDPTHRAAGVGRVRGLAGPMDAAWRQEMTRRRRPRETIFSGAVNPQQVAATFKDRLTRVGCRVRGALRKEKGGLKALPLRGGRTTVALQRELSKVRFGLPSSRRQ
jgi:hypothetical protein